jgi:hypothetical protein
MAHQEKFHNFSLSTIIISAALSRGGSWPHIGHNTANIGDEFDQGRTSMPSLLRFLTICGVLGALFYGSMYVLAKYYEPDTKEISKPIRNIKLR